VIVLTDGRQGRIIPTVAIGATVEFQGTGEMGWRIAESRPAGAGE
jgi:hypothetical protein